MPVADPALAVARPDPPRAGRPAPRLRWWGWFGWPLLGLLLAAVRAPVFSLNGDVRYTLGALRTTAQTGWSPAEVWAHRPMTNRLLMAAVDRFTWGEPATREVLWLFAGGLLCGIAAACLARALRHHLPAAQAAAVAVGVLAALLWAPQRDVWQPEWSASWLAVGAVAAGLSRRRWGVPVSAVLLVATALMKYTTATTAVVALLVLALVRLRRAVVVALLTGVVGLVVLAVQFALVPVEWTWFTELSALNSDFTGQWWCATGDAWEDCPPQSLLATMGLLSPLLLVWPAAIGVLAVRSRGTARRVALVVPVAAVLVVGAGVVVQSSWYSYQLDALPVLAAAWVAWAVAASPWPGRVVLALGTLLAAVSSWWLMTPPLELREEAPPVLGGLPRTELAYWGQLVLLLALLVLAVGVVRAAGRAPDGRPGRVGAPARRAALLAGTAVVLVGLAGALLPSMPFSYGFQLGGYTPEQEKDRREQSLAEIAEIDQRIGPDAPVVYLAFGEDSYLFDHPTYCRYAAATYLQRNLWADTEQLQGFADNLACLEDPRAEYVVVNDHWMKLDRERLETVREAVEREFDCADDVGTGTWQVCPRRDG